MKNILFIVIFLSFKILSAQDIIVLNSADEIKSRVVEITQDQVKYKKWSNLNGPIYSANKVDIFVIKYQNGEKEIFKKDINIKENDSNIIGKEKNQNSTVEVIEDICLKLNKSKVFVNSEVIANNCSKDGSVFFWENSNGEQSEGFRNEQKSFKFKQSGEYTIKLIIYSKDKKIRKELKENVTVISNANYSLDVSIGSLNAVGNFGNQNMDFFDIKNSTSCISGGTIIQLNSDGFPISEQGEELVGIRASISSGMLNYAPLVKANITNNTINTVRTLFFGLGPIYRDNNAKFRGQAGLLFGWYGYNPNNQYFNIYDKSQNINWVLAYEPQNIGTGLGIQVNSELEWRLSNWISLLFRYEFFHSSVKVDMKMSGKYFGNWSQLDQQTIEKSINYFHSGFGIKINY